MKPVNDLLDWLDSRTGWRTGRRKLLEEPIQAGVGWWFVTGSILLMLLTVQFVTGVVLAMFVVLGYRAVVSFRESSAAPVRQYL